MIMASCILHNACTIVDHGTYADLEEFGHDLMWQAHLKMFKPIMCPSCVRRGAAHCVHIAANRNRRALHLSTDGRQMRACVRDMLWAAVEASGQDETTVRDIMREAHTETPGAQHDDAVHHVRRQVGPLPQQIHAEGDGMCA